MLNTELLALPLRTKPKPQTLENQKPKYPDPKLHMPFPSQSSFPSCRTLRPDHSEPALIVLVSGDP